MHRHSSLFSCRRVQRPQTCAIVYVYVCMTICNVCNACIYTCMCMCVSEDLGKTLQLIAKLVFVGVNFCINVCMHPMSCARVFCIYVHVCDRGFKTYLWCSHTLKLCLCGMYVFNELYAYKCVSRKLYVSITHVYIYVHIHTHTHTHTHIYVYIYIYTHTHIPYIHTCFIAVQTHRRDSTHNENMHARTHKCTHTLEP